MANNSKLVPLSDIEEINKADIADFNEADYATGAEGDLATSALQPEDIASGTITARTDDIDFSGGSDGDVVTVQADGSLALETPAGGSGTTNNFNNEFIDQSGGTSDTYGVLSGTVNGSNTTFTVSESIYATGTLTVYLNGQLQTQGSGEDWVETTPASGTFDFNTAPLTGDLITVKYQSEELSSDTVAVKSTTMGTIVHGATAGTARPADYAVVTWIGSVEPTNATTNDLWVDTA